MELIKDGWFSEKSPLWPGQAFSIQVSKVLHHEKSKYQDILIFESVSYGTVLVLDGIIQCTKRDEFCYQEMISMLGLCTHPRPEKVLIVGGGDGGVARDVAKHPQVQKIHQVEIDDRVVQLSKQYLPFMACGFDNPKMILHIGDGFEFIKKHDSEFDVIITDSSDPVGPNESLFQDDYFRLLRSALRPGGVICSQASAPMLDLPPIRRHVDACRRHFPVVRYALTSVPSYPSGQIGFLVASIDQSLDPAIPKACGVPSMRYYTPELHKAAFILPGFMESALFK